MSRRKVRPGWNKGKALPYEKHQEILVTPPPGWEIDGDAHVNRALGVTANILVGREGDGLVWFTLCLWEQKGVGLPSPDRLYAACLSFGAKPEKTRCKVRVILNKAGGVGLELKSPIEGQEPTDLPPLLTRDVIARAIAPANGSRSSN